MDYVFNTKDPQYEEDPSVSARLQRLQNDFEQHGIRHTVGREVKSSHLLRYVVRDCRSKACCSFTNMGSHPHVLLLQVANAYFKLPGDYLKPDEPDKPGLGVRLDMRLGPKARDGQPDDSVEKKQMTYWEVHDLLAQWWRPNYEQFMVKSMYLVQLPKHKVFTVPSNMKLIAIPLLELYDNAVRLVLVSIVTVGSPVMLTPRHSLQRLRYGPLLAAVPHLLSKYRFEIG
ncbi:BQ2448_672 [Microbotryum intermedium]|uniref:BQ2448_672 protein n=1 Tax=Microbotryum intermedium TaxID=269621 RepID=A0A238F8X2_9BASI|nr:BQ2448_672 [Microbotryum intermedium]